MYVQLNFLDVKVEEELAKEDFEFSSKGTRSKQKSLQHNRIVGSHKEKITAEDMNIDVSKESKRDQNTRREMPLCHIKITWEN